MGRLERSTGNGGTGETGAIALELRTRVGMVMMKRPEAASTSGSQESEESSHRDVPRVDGGRS